MQRLVEVVAARDVIGILEHLRERRMRDAVLERRVRDAVDRVAAGSVVAQPGDELRAPGRLGHARALPREIRTQLVGLLRGREVRRAEGQARHEHEQRVALAVVVAAVVD
ncbi:MAG TPA: hypothetical protein VGB85_04080, partial [Nannocystis sp.]